MLVFTDTHSKSYTHYNIDTNAHVHTEKCSFTHAVKSSLAWNPCVAHKTSVICNVNREGDVIHMAPSKSHHINYFHDNILSITDYSCRQHHRNRTEREKRRQFWLISVTRHLSAKVLGSLQPARSTQKHSYSIITSEANTGCVTILQTGTKWHTLDFPKFF